MSGACVHIRASTGTTTSEQEGIQGRDMRLVQTDRRYPGWLIRASQSTQRQIRPWTHRKSYWMIVTRTQQHSFMFQKYRIRNQKYKYNKTAVKYSLVSCRVCVRACVCVSCWYFKFCFVFIQIQSKGEADLTERTRRAAGLAPPPQTVTRSSDCRHTAHAQCLRMTHRRTYRFL